MQTNEAAETNDNTDYTAWRKPHRNEKQLGGEAASLLVGFHNCYIIITVLHTTNIYKNSDATK